MGGEKSKNARPKPKLGTSTPTLVKIANMGMNKRRESGDETPFCTKTGCQWK